MGTRDGFSKIEKKINLIRWIVGSIIGIVTVVVSLYAAGIFKKDFAVIINPNEIECYQGGSAKVNVSVKDNTKWGTYAEPVNLEGEILPEDIKVQFFPTSPTKVDYTAEMTISASKGIKPGKYTLRVIGAGQDGVSHSTELLVEVKEPPCPRPFIVEVEQNFAPNGWMCNASDLTMDTQCKDAPYSGPTCTRISYSARTRTACQTDGWVGAGVYWFCFGCNWGEEKPDPVKYDFSCANSLIFMAKGARGGEQVEFKVGGVVGKFRDSLYPAKSTGVITLSNMWQQYRITFQEGDDLTSMISGFCWVTNRDWNPNGCTIYLDDIKFMDE